MEKHSPGLLRSPAPSGRGPSSDFAFSAIPYFDIIPYILPNCNPSSKLQNRAREIAEFLGYSEKVSARLQLSSVNPAFALEILVYMYYNQPIVFQIPERPN